MRKLLKSARQLCCSLATVAVSTVALAATPVAVWDGNFNVVQPGYTLNLNGNQLSQDNSTITISQNVGVTVTSEGTFSSGFTVLFRYSNLDLSLSARQVLAATRLTDEENRTGAEINGSGQSCGVWKGASWNTSGTYNAMTSGQTAGVFAYAHYSTTTYSGTGTQLYCLTNGICNTIVDAGGLGSRDDTAKYKGASVGGPTASISGASAATGMEITAIAIFQGVLSVPDIAAYKFPMDDADPIAADTTVSALNAQFGSATNLKLKFSPGVKLTMDAAFTATSVKIVSGGSIELAAASQPSAEELAKFDFSGVLGAVKRSWLGPDVIGFNFNSDGYCQSYYYGGAVDASSAIASGIWYANAQSPNASSNVCSDALTVVSWSSANVWAERSGLWRATFIQGYLDDGNGGATVTVTGLPYEKYDVIVYASSDASNGVLRAKWVNGDYYTWDSVSGKTVKGTDSWGCAQVSATPIYGTNCLRIDDLSGTLTIKGGTNAGAGGRGGISAIQIIPADVVIDATSGFTPDATRLANIRKDYRDVTLVGDGANGAMIDFGSTAASISSHIVFDGGTHTLKYSGSASTVNLGANEENPIFETINGAKVNFYQHDLTGWSGSQITSTTDIRVGAGTTMDIYPYGSGTTYYRGRYTIEPGARVTSYYNQTGGNGAPAFRLHGGAVEGHEQIYVPESASAGAAHAVLEGAANANNGINLAEDATAGAGVFVGTNSVLDVNIDISGVASAPLGKWGEGTLNLNASMSGYLGTLSIHEGTVNVTTATTLASVVNGEGATLAYSYAAKPTIESYSGAGAIVVDVSSLVEGGAIPSGTYQIAPSGAPSALVTVTGLPEGSDFKVVATEDNGIVLTDADVFSPEWTGASSTWTSEVYDGRTGYADGKHLVFSQGVPAEESVTVTVAGAKAPASMSFIADTTAYTLTGDAISTTGDISVSGTTPVVFDTPLSVGGAVSLAAGTSLTVSTNDFTIAAGALSGSGALVLDPGEGGEFTMPGGNTSYTGEAIVKSGTVFMGDATAFGPLNKANGIRVKGGAVLSSRDVTCGEGLNYADTAYKNKAILEEGATLVPWRNNDYKLGAFSALALEGNATVDATDCDTGLSLHYNYTWAHLALGTYTLTKIGNKDFYISAPKITGTGKINVIAGTITISSSSYASRPGSFTDGTLEIAAGAGLQFVDYTHYMAGGGSLTVKNLILNGYVKRQSATYSTLTVTGYITGSGTTPMLTMGSADAKLVPTGRGSIKVTESLNLYDDKLIIDLSGFDFSDDSLMSVPLFRVGSTAILPSANAIWFKYSAGGELTQVVPEGWRLRTCGGGRGYVLTRRGYTLIMR